MATVKPLYLAPTTGRITVIQSGDTIDPSLISGGGGGVTSVLNVRAATTANITISIAPAFIDGVNMTSGDLVLVKDQTLARNNGVYTYNGAASAMTRVSGLDVSAEAFTGLLITVAEGTTNLSTLWMLTTPQPVTLGTTALTFSLVGTAGIIATDVTVNFGTTPVYSKAFTVTIPGLQVGQRVECVPSGYTPAGVYFDEHEFGVLMWVGKVTATDTLSLIGSSTSAISGQRIVQISTKFNSAQMFVQLGMQASPDYLFQSNNVI